MKIRINENDEYKKYEKLIEKLAFHYYKKTHFDIDELKSVGNIAYVKALHTHRITESKFSTYLFSCVRNEILTYIKKQSKENWGAIDEQIEAHDDFIKKIECEDTINTLTTGAKKVIKMMNDGKKIYKNNRYITDSIRQELIELYKR